MHKTENPKSNLTIYRTKYFNLPWKRLNSTWSLIFYTFNSLMEASRLACRENVQVLHGHTIQWGGLQSSLVSKMTGKPYVITVHGSGLDRYSQNSMPHRLKFLRTAKFVICQKVSAARKLKTWGLSEDKVILVKGLVDTEKFRPTLSKSNQSEFVISFVGRITKFKGPQILLKAIPYILSKHPNTLIQFVGEGDLKKPLIRMAESMGISKHTRFLGFRPDVDEILRKSDAFVSASKHENVSDLSLLEAMATGVPVVATDVGETNTIVKDGETGLLTKYNSKDVAEKLLRIMNDRELAINLSKQERKYVENHHEIEVLGAKHRKIYQTVINNQERIQSECIS